MNIMDTLQHALIGQLNDNEALEYAQALSKYDTCEKSDKYSSAEEEVSPYIFKPIENISFASYSVCSRT
jgi:hypothetical protein